MRVQFDLVGQDTSKDGGIFSEIVVYLHAIPKVGDVINWPGLSQADTYVRTVVWYISHDDDDNKLEEPFVYVVVGPQRQKNTFGITMYGGGGGGGSFSLSEPDKRG